ILHKFQLNVCFLVYVCCDRNHACRKDFYVCYEDFYRKNKNLKIKKLFIKKNFFSLKNQSDHPPFLSYTILISYKTKNNTYLILLIHSKPFLSKITNFTLIFVQLPEIHLSNRHFE
ncbi:hypothetical protein BpHYR1_027165, partial [Brachionus plicatilis]